MDNFASVADIQHVIQQEITDPLRIADAEFALLTVSAAIRNYTKQVLSLVTGDNIYLDVSRFGPLVFLPQLPVVSVDAVIEGAVPLNVVDDYQLMRLGALRRVNQFWALGAGVVGVRYTHGYATIPDDIRTITARAASRLFQAGLRAAETNGVPGVVSKQLGDFSVSYGADSASEGQLGASGARPLLLSEKDILDAYRIP